MDDLSLILDDCSVVEISQIIGPYLRCYLRDRGRSQHGLRLLLSFDDGDIVLQAGDVHGTSPLLQQMDIFLEIKANGDLGERAILDLMAHVPGEEIVHFETFSDQVTMGDVYPLFPNLKALSFDCAPLQTIFPEPDLGRDKETFLSLQQLSLRGLVVDRGDWSPLITFLARRVSSGNRLDTLEISDSSRMTPEVMKAVRGMVRELNIESPFVSA